MRRSNGVVAAGVFVEGVGVGGGLNHFRCAKWDQIPYFSIRR